MAKKNAYDQLAGNVNSSYKKGYQAQKDSLNNAYNANVKNANAAYTTNARQAYVTYRQNQSGLNDTLSNNGMTGGAGETSAVRLNTAYANNIGTAAASRDSAVAQAALTRDTAIASARQNLYDRSAATRLALGQSKISQANVDKANSYKYFANTVTNRYGSKRAWKKAINSQTDKIKRAYLQQGYQNWLASKKANSTSSSGGSGSRSSSRSSSSSSSYSAYTSPTTPKKTQSVAGSSTKKGKPSLYSNWKENEAEILSHKTENKKKAKDTGFALSKNFNRYVR